MAELLLSGQRIGLFKDPVSAITHFVGMLLAFVGTVALVVAAGPEEGVRALGMGVYGFSLVVLLGASSLYHFVDVGERGNQFLRRVDHAGIYLLIGGSYVPPVLHLMEGSWRVGMLTIIWALALLGMVLKLLWADWPEWLSVSLYLGFSGVAFVPLARVLPGVDGPALGWAVAGGIAYVVGAAVYFWEWPDPWPRVFGHHELWHVFVLVGAGCHYFMVWSFLSLPCLPL
jgi:hemolysin III